MQYNAVVSYEAALEIFVFGETSSDKAPSVSDLSVLILQPLRLLVVLLMSV